MSLHTRVEPRVANPPPYDEAAVQRTITVWACRVCGHAWEDGKAGCGNCGAPFCDIHGEIKASCGCYGLGEDHCPCQWANVPADRDGEDFAISPPSRLLWVLKRLDDARLALREVETILPLRLSDHKGTLTVYWPHVGALRLKAVAEKSWEEDGREQAEAVEHRVGQRGLMVFPAFGEKASPMDEESP